MCDSNYELKYFRLSPRIPHLEGGRLQNIFLLSIKERGISDENIDSVIINLEHVSAPFRVQISVAKLVVLPCWWSTGLHRALSHIFQCTSPSCQGCRPRPPTKKENYKRLRRRRWRRRRLPKSSSSSSSSSQYSHSGGQKLPLAISNTG